MDLRAYQRSIATVSADQNEVGIPRPRGGGGGPQRCAAQDQLGAGSRSLQSSAVSEYVSSGLYSGAPLVSDGGTQPCPNTPQDSDGVVAQQYLGVAATEPGDADSRGRGL